MTNPLHLDVPAGVPWIDFTREFDAPVAAVFDAHRDPAKVVRWLGPRGYEMLAERWDTSPAEAFELLRSAARSHRMRVHDLARRVLLSRSTPPELREVEPR